MGQGTSPGGMPSLPWPDAGPPAGQAKDGQAAGGRGHSRSLFWTRDGDAPMGRLAVGRPRGKGKVKRTSAHGRKVLLEAGRGWGPCR